MQENASIPPESLALNCFVSSVTSINMVTTYKLNTTELEHTFIDSIKTAYPDQVV